MIKNILIILALSIFSYASELPIEHKYFITIENGEFTVFEFPFKIRKTFSSGFLLSSDSKEIKKLRKKEKNDSALREDDNRNKVVKKNKIIQIKQGTKSLTFLPRARGNFKLVLWGYKKYPLMFDITVVDKNKKNEGKLDNYYKFVDYSQNKKEATKFETTSHEQTIVKLLRSIYNKKIPQGYENKSGAERYEDKTFIYTRNMSYIGNKYSVEEWYIQNKTNKKISLYEEQFLVDGIYGISFENNILLPFKTTRMFIIKRTKQ